MRPRTALASIVVSVIITFIAAPSPAQQQQPRRTDGGSGALGQNAALRYWQAFAVFPKLDDRQQKVLSDSASAAGGVDGDARDVAESGKNALLYLRRGAAIGP